MPNLRNRAGRQESGRIHVASQSHVSYALCPPLFRARFYLDKCPCHHSHFPPAPLSCLSRLALFALPTSQRCGSAHVFDVGQDCQVSCDSYSKYVLSFHFLYIFYTISGFLYSSTCYMN